MCVIETRAYNGNCDLQSQQSFNMNSMNTRVNWKKENVKLLPWAKQNSWRRQHLLSKQVLRCKNKHLQYTELSLQCVRYTQHEDFIFWSASESRGQAAVKTQHTGCSTVCVSEFILCTDALVWSSRYQVSAARQHWIQRKLNQAKGK